MVFVRGVFQRALFIAAAGVVMAGSSDSYAEEKMSFKTQKGLNFAVPEDWPIEEHGGALAPISVEEYVSRKFKAVEERLDVIEKSLSEKEKAVEVPSSGVTNSGEPSPEITGLLGTLAKDTEELKAQMEFLKNETPARSAVDQSVSDKNLADQIRLIKTHLEEMERRLGTIEFHQDI